MTQSIVLDKFGGSGRRGGRRYITNSLRLSLRFTLRLISANNWYVRLDSSVSQSALSGRDWGRFRRSSKGST